MARKPIERWTQTRINEVAEDLKKLGAKARLPRAELIKLIPYARVTRLKQWVHKNGLLSPLGEEEIVSDDVSLISQWDDQGKSNFETVPMPEEEAAAHIPIEDLIENAKAQFRRSRATAALMGPRSINMPPGPYSITHFGDPHVDDPGCDWEDLDRTIKTIANTPAMYGGNGGDLDNNWVGRLVEIYAEQETTQSQSDRLIKHIFTAIPWLYIVLGNHDLWNKNGRYLRRVASDGGVKLGVMAPDEVKIETVSPNGFSLKIHARHDFNGHSMWNDAHALKKAAVFQPWGDMFCGFHRHVSVVHQEETGDGRMKTFIRARGFKRFDAYARSKGFPEQKYGASITTIVDPDAPDTEKVRVVWDVEEAAELLTWLRRRRGF